jgi:glucose-1-phosphate adenylyltransferase
MQDVLCLILGGGRGKRLYPLTKSRSEPAVPVGGKYRLIDIPISNCLNSGLKRIYVLTQFLSASLHRHIAQTYKFDPFGRGFVEVLAAQQTNEAADWYQGTADAIRQNIRYVRSDPATDVLILSGDQLYRRDFQPLLKVHRESGADVTLAMLPVARSQAANLGLLRLDETGRILELVEKPKTQAEFDRLRTSADWLARRGILDRDREFLANMGIYVFRREALFELLGAFPLAVDLVTEIFSRCLQTHRMKACLCDGYWRDLGTIKSYHEANLALTDDEPPFDFHSMEGVIYSRMRNLPASRVSAADLNHCLVSDGCVVLPGARLERCVLGVRSRIGREARLRDTVIIGADRFETDAERAQNRENGIPDFTVGAGSVIESAILDKDCRIGRNVRIGNRNGVRDAEGVNYVIRDGIVVIPNGAVVPDGTVL